MTEWCLWGGRGDWKRWTGKRGTKYAGVEKRRTGKHGNIICL